MVGFSASPPRPPRTRRMATLPTHLPKSPDERDSLSVGSGLIGSKEDEGLGRTELLSSKAEDWRGCVSSPAGGLAGAVEGVSESSSLLLLDSAVEMPLSARRSRRTSVP